MKTCTSRARFAALPLALAAAFPLHAETNDTTELAETVVTATRNTQLLSATLAHTTLITREEIERSQAVDLVTLLQREAGLQRIQNGGIGNTATIFIRGAPALQTLVLIDGVPQNKQDASGAVSIEHVMLDNVERIEIVRGNVSAIYGSGAIGGVIQIFTRAGSKKPSATVSLEFGPRASGKVVANASVSVGETAISAGVSRVTTDGFSAVNTSQFPTANPDQDGYQNTSTNLSMTHQLSQNHQIGLRMTQAQGDTGYDNYFGAATDQQSSTTKLNQATIFSANQWGNWNSRVSLSQQSDKSVTRDDGLYGAIDGFTTQATVLTWVNTLALGGDWLATGGAEQQKQHVETNSSSPFNAIYEQNRTSNALFTGIEGNVAGGHIQFNLRNDTVGELQQTTGYLGYGYPLTEQLKAIVSASTAFNAPPLGYLFAPGWGNPLLKPELAQSREVGLQYAQGKHLLRATIFDTRVEDELMYDKTISKFSNISRTKNSGVELSYQTSLGKTEWRASLTEQNPVDEMTGELLPRRAKTMASIGFSQMLGAWQAGANLRYSGERNDAYSDPATWATVKTKLAAYSVLDLTASYRWSPEVLLTARLDNATDEHYQTIFGYNQQPRSLYAGLTWTPKR